MIATHENNRFDEELHRKVCDVLMEIRRRFPDYRLGQLLANMANLAGTDSWDVEDEELLAVAEPYLKSNWNRLEELEMLRASAAYGPV